MRELNVKTQYLGRTALGMKEVDSTNDLLKQLAETGGKHGMVVYADSQRKGRGRMGRTWDSPGGDNIYMSVLLKPDMEPCKVSMITLVAALGAVEAIKEVTGAECRIKWPNDLVLQGKKICGILTEASMKQNSVRYVIVGIGMNVNREHFPEEIAHMAGSLALSSIEEDLSHERKDKESLIESFLYHFENKYKEFIKVGDLSPFLDEYNRRLAGIDCQVEIIAPEGRSIRTSRGIDRTGALIVTDQTGRKEKIISGEVSVRGLYGYVDK